MNYKDTDSNHGCVRMDTAISPPPLRAASPLMDLDGEAGGSSVKKDSSKAQNLRGKVSKFSPETQNLHDQDNLVDEDRVYTQGPSSDLRRGCGQSEKDYLDANGLEMNLRENDSHLYHGAATSGKKVGPRRCSSVSWSDLGGRGDQAVKRPTSRSGPRCGPASRRRRRSHQEEELVESDQVGSPRKINVRKGSADDENASALLRMDISSDGMPPPIHVDDDDEDELSCGQAEDRDRYNSQQGGHPASNRQSRRSNGMSDDDDIAEEDDLYSDHQHPGKRRGHIAHLPPSVARGLKTPGDSPASDPPVTPVISDSASPSILNGSKGGALNVFRRTQSEHRPTPEPDAFKRTGELRKKVRSAPRERVGYTPRPPPTPYSRVFMVRNPAKVSRDLRRMMSPLSPLDPNSPMQSNDAQMLIPPKNDQQKPSQKRKKPTNATQPSYTIPRLHYLRDIGSGNFASVYLVEEIHDDAERQGAAMAIGSGSSSASSSSNARATRSGRARQTKQGADLLGTPPRPPLRSPAPRLFALKENNEPFLSTEVSLSYKSLLRSTNAWADLPEHPHIVKIICAWKEQGRIKIQMEFCQGGNLLDYVEVCLQTPSLRSKWGEPQIWRCMYDALSGLSHLHKHGLCHNDIKPGNLFMGGQPSRLMLGDFGHLRRPDDEADGEEGDVRYIPREVLENKFSFAGDVFMLGISFFEVVADVDLPDTGAWHHLRDGDIPPLPDGLSQELYNTLRDMMHPDPQKRPSAEELLQRDSIAQAKLTALPDLDIFQTSPMSMRHAWSPQPSARTHNDPMRTPEQTNSPMPMWGGSPLDTPAPVGRSTSSSSSTSAFKSTVQGRVDFSPMIDSTPSSSARRSHRRASSSSSMSSSSTGQPHPFVDFTESDMADSPVTPDRMGRSTLRSQGTRPNTRSQRFHASESAIKSSHALDKRQYRRNQLNSSKSHQHHYASDEGEDDVSDGGNAKSLRGRRLTNDQFSDTELNEELNSSPRKCLLDEFEDMDCK